MSEVWQRLHDALSAVYTFFVVGRDIPAASIKELAEASLQLEDDYSLIPSRYVLMVQDFVDLDVDTFDYHTLAELFIVAFTHTQHPPFRARALA